MNTTIRAQTRPYQARNGNMQVKPSLQLVMTMNGKSEGFCLSCGGIQGGVEPDAKGYKCVGCDAPKVYGPESLVMMDLTFDAEL